MTTLGTRALMCLLSIALIAGCAADLDSDAEASVGLHGEALRLSRECNDSFDSVYTAPSELPDFEPSRRGDVVRCSTGRSIAPDEIAATLLKLGFAGVPARSPVQLYRISYRTTRVGKNGDLSSALVVLPANNRITQDGQGQNEGEGENGGQAGARAPLIVFGHGTVPFGPTCGYSKYDPARDLPDRELASLLAFATLGFPVIMPDFPGFVAGSTVTGYILSEDEAQALLDATRAMQKLVQDPPDRVAMVGHSQGGHAVLSAQALARSYGMAGQLIGIAAMAPFWAVGRTFGAIVSPEFMFNTTDNPGPLAFAVEYFYTHAELYDGAGRGPELFKPEVRSALQGYVSSCSFEASPAVLGFSAADFFQPDFLDAVAGCGVFGADACSGGLAGTWETRFRADRPQLDPAGAPVVMWHGANDAVIEPALAKCAIDKLSADLQPLEGTAARFTFCGDAAADHESLLSNDIAWVARWIEARAGNGGEPPSCPGSDALEGGNGPLSCLTPPGNDD